MKFKSGDMVKVNNSKLLTHGCIGYIDSFTSYGSSVNVTLEDGKTLTYKLTNLIPVEKEESNKMYITGDFKVAKVKFLSGTNTNTEYEYAMFDDCCKVGDIAVVASAHHGLGLAKIAGIISKDEAVTKKFEREIVAPVYMGHYEQRKQNRARLQELDNRMNQRVQELNKLAIFEMMAEKDESLKGMLDEYKTLIGV